MCFLGGFPGRLPRRPSLVIMIIMIIMIIIALFAGDARHAHTPRLERPAVYGNFDIINGPRVVLAVSPPFLSSNVYTACRVYGAKRRDELFRRESHAAGPQRV